MKNTIFAVGVGVGLLGWVESGKGAISTQLYKIDSGAYVVLGGFISVVSNSLPNVHQAYLELIYDSDAATATWRILSDDQSHVFQTLGPASSSGSEVAYYYLVPHPIPEIFDPLPLFYEVSWGGGSVRLHGSIEALRPLCCDVANEFHHMDVIGTLVEEPPVDLVGVYDFQGFSALGSADGRGVVVIDSGPGLLGGNWRLQSAEAPWVTGPLDGRGELTGQEENGEFRINLHPGLIDDNVILEGVASQGTLTGKWTYITFVGLEDEGTFSAVRRDIKLMKPRLDEGGIVCSFNLAAGMLGVLESTDDLVLGRWQEVRQFVSSGQLQEWSDPTVPSGGRFYRLRILNAVDPITQEECARVRLADHLGVPWESVHYISSGPQEFPNSCCGCETGAACADVITPGAVFVFEVDGEMHNVNWCGSTMTYCTTLPGARLPACEELAP